MPAIGGAALRQKEAMTRPVLPALCLVLPLAALPAADLVTGLGNPPPAPLTAGLYADGFGEHAFPHSLDDSVAVDITSVFPNGLRFGGQLRTEMFINGHGNVTFVQEDGSGMVPQEIQATASFPRIAPFFADTDTRTQISQTSPGGTSKGSNRIYWDLDSVGGVITVTWDDVGYYNNKTNWVNAYQLRLHRVGTAGDFDIEFRYEYIGWTSGEEAAFQGGVDGLGGVIARAGYTAADGLNFYELPQSGRQGTRDAITIDPPGSDLATAGGMLDLAQLSNVGTPGVFIFRIRRPQVTITPPTGTWTNVSPIVFTVTFDQPVTGFTAADLTLSGGTLGAVSTVTAGTVYTVPVTPTGDGVVTLGVVENGAASAAGNGNAAASVAVNSDQTPPSVVSITPNSGQIHTANASFAVVFSEPMIGLTANDFTTSNGTIAGLSGSGASWLVTVATASDAALTLTLPASACTDRAGNQLAAPGAATVAVDITGPSVDVTHAVASGRTNATTPQLFTITFSEDVTGFTPADVRVANGTAAAAFASATASVYSIEVTPTVDGLVSLTVPAAVAFNADSLGNLAGANAFRLDRAAPTATIAPSGGAIGTDGVFTVTFSEAMTGFDAGDITVTNGVAGAPELVPGTVATYRVTITAAGGGDVGIAIPSAPGLTDLAGNPLAAAATTTITHDAALAPLEILTAATQPTTGATIPVTFRFAAPATGFAAGDVVVVNGSAGALVDAGGGDYTMAITPAAAGLVTISVAANACTVGGAGNESATLVVNHQPTGPIPTFSVAPLAGGRPEQVLWLTISFTEDVSGLVAGDLVLDGCTILAFTQLDARTWLAKVQLAPRPNTTGSVTLPAASATGANGRAVVGGSITLLAPDTSNAANGSGSALGSKNLCGQGTSLAVLLLLLIGWLQGGGRLPVARPRE